LTDDPSHPAAKSIAPTPFETRMPAARHTTVHRELYQRRPHHASGRSPASFGLRAPEALKAGRALRARAAEGPDDFTCEVMTRGRPLVPNASSYRPRFCRVVVCRHVSARKVE
jgi:hypothetical protein